MNADANTKKIDILDRLNIECGPDKVISRWHLGGHTRGHMGYWCAKPFGTHYTTGGSTLQCRDDQATPVDIQGHWDNLWRLGAPSVRVGCEKDEMMQRFQMSRSATHFNFHFRCCKVETKIPNKCHTGQCAAKSKAANDAGFCLRDFGSCWQPDQALGDWLLQASSDGTFMGSTNCDKDGEGAV